MVLCECLLSCGRSEQLYQRHGDTICEYLTHTVLPALRHQRSEFLLTELTQRWANHKIMNRWMQKFFMYLDRYYVKHHSMLTLDVAGLKHFKTLVYSEVKKDVVNASKGGVASLSLSLSRG